jgi:hypothetical protein
MQRSDILALLGSLGITGLLQNIPNYESQENAVAAFGK